MSKACVGGRSTRRRTWPRCALHTAATYFHRGDWTFEQVTPWQVSCEGRLTLSQRKELRDVKKVLRPFAQLNAVYVNPGTCADCLLNVVRTVHGTVSWQDGEELRRGSDMPQEVKDVVNGLNQAFFEIVNPSGCFD